MRAFRQVMPCFYMWIDRPSVPRDESHLQNTSMMIAIFASARDETLVMRSRESGAMNG